MNQHPSGFPLGLDDLTTSPCWQEISPLSQGLLLASSNTPTYTEHSCLTCSQEGQKEGTTQRSERRRDPPRADIEIHGEMRWRGQLRMSDLPFHLHSSRKGKFLLCGLKGGCRIPVDDWHILFLTREDVKLS